MAKILILGAGSSHGHGLSGETRPPLASQFFDCRQGRGLISRYALLSKFLSEEIGIDLDSNTSLNIEDIFARVEAFWRFGKKEWRWIYERYGAEFVSVSPVDMLRSYITDLIYSSMCWVGQRDCPYHDFLIRSWLSPGDAVISFNYDLLADVTLQKWRTWNEQTGYGFIPREGGEVLDSEVLLLKPHGSLNWFRSTWTRFLSNKIEKVPAIFVLTLDRAVKGQSPKLEEENAILHIGPRGQNAFGQVLPDDYLDEQKFDLNVEFIGDELTKMDLYEKGYLPLMIMPTPNKPYDEMTFAELQTVWSEIRARLESADEILSVGFSFRDEHFSQMLFSASRLHRSPLPITVVTKDLNEFDRIKRRFRKVPIDLRHFNGWLLDYVRRQTG